MFISSNEEETDLYETTKLGLASFYASLSPDDALFLYKELQVADKRMRIKDELYACYLLTPLVSLPDPDWDVLNSLYEASLDDDDIAVLLKNIGITRSFVRKSAENPPRGSESLTIIQARRAYLALQLHQTINEVPLETVAKRFNVDRGELQTRMQSAAMFAATVVSFCRRMEMWQLETLLGAYATRFDFGVKMDVAPLMEISGVGQSRARDLFKAGFTTVEKVASALPQKLLVSVPSFSRVGLTGAQKIVENAKRVLKREALEAVSAADMLLRKSGGSGLQISSVPQRKEMKRRYLKSRDVGTNPTDYKTRKESVFRK